MQQQLAWFDEKTVPAGWKIPSYTLNARSDLRKIAKKENVTFIREDGVAETKTMFWCLEHGYYELQHGVWSGLWYWDKLKELGQKKKHQPLPPDVQKRMVAGKNEWHASGLLRDISADTMKNILKVKQHADEHFASLNYHDACWFYHSAIQEFPRKLIVLRKEHMDLALCILNLQTECYLKMEKWSKAEDSAAYALEFDEFHEESRFQRGKATFGWIMKVDSIMRFTLPAATCDEDLWYVMNLKNGKRQREACELYDAFHAKVDEDKKEITEAADDDEL